MKTGRKKKRVKNNIMLSTMMMMKIMLMRIIRMVMVKMLIKLITIMNKMTTLCR